MDRQTNKWTDRKRDGQTDKQRDGQTDKGMDRQKKQRDGQMDKQKDGYHRQTNKEETYNPLWFQRYGTNKHPLYQ